ncbi:hypothetical protein RPW65_05575 [Pseudomonas sp. NyZ704]|nr:hypothetical protein RPW65_05575 [Pseudomonas sp. NyZ704]
MDEELTNQIKPYIDLLHGEGAPMLGIDMTEQKAIALAEQKCPYKSWCIVKDWVWVDLVRSPKIMESFQRAGTEPTMLYAHHVINDSRGRFPPGGWVRSSPLLTFSDGCLFETRNTVYVLTGNGKRKEAALETVMGIF